MPGRSTPSARGLDASRRPREVAGLAPSDRARSRHDPDVAQVISPVERHSVADQVAKKILDLVRTGNLKPGDQLPTERDLSQMLQVSRPSVREALRGLQILGVVKTRQGGGAYISSLDAADLLGPLQVLITLNAQNVEALYQARVMIDGGIARLAAELLTDADIARLAAIVTVQKKLLSDPIGFRVSDLEFHRTICRIDRQPVPGPRLAFPLRARHRVPPHRLGPAGRAQAVARRPRRHRQGARPRATPTAPAAAMETHIRNVHRIDQGGDGEGEVSGKARIGVIGAGWWAVVNHIPVLKALPDCEVVAVNRLGAAELAGGHGEVRDSRRLRGLPRRCWPRCRWTASSSPRRTRSTSSTPRPRWRRAATCWSRSR